MTEELREGLAFKRFSAVRCLDAITPVDRGRRSSLIVPAPHHAIDSRPRLDSCYQDD